MKDSRLTTWAAGLSLLGLGLALFLSALPRLPLIRGEAMYALIPAEMLARGDWLTPYLNGSRYLDKPPLWYWLTMAVYQIFGVSELSARLTTVAVALGEVLGTFLLGRALWSVRAGWLAGLILLTSIGFFTLHCQLFTDHLISLTLTWALYFLVRWEGESRFRQVAGFYACLAAGLLSKGLVGPALTLAVGGLYMLVRWDWRLLRLFLHPGGLAVFAALALPWFVVMALRHPGFFEFHVLNEQILRFVGERQPPDIVSFPIVGFWLFVVIWLMPWAAFLPAALVAFWPRRGTGGDPRERGKVLVLLWAGVVLGFFSLSSLRLEYYSLPAFPAVALILGWRFDLYLTRERDRAMRASLALLTVLLTGLLLAPVVIQSLAADNRREFLTIFGTLAPIVQQARFVLPGLGMATLVLGWRGRPRLCLASLTVTAGVLLWFTFQCLALLNTSLTDREFGDYLARHAPRGATVIMESLEEFEYASSLGFASGRRVLIVQRQGVPAFGFPLKAEENYLISPARLRELWEGPERVYLLTDEVKPREDHPEEAYTVLAADGKRLLSNRPEP